MRLRLWLLTLFLLALGGGSWAGPPEQPPTVIFEGVPRDSRFGAAVIQPSGAVLWIDGLTYWPAELETKSRMLVSGQLVERFDLPVYEANPGDEPRDGVPFPPGTDLREASRRIFAQYARWNLIDAATDPFYSLKKVEVLYNDGVDNAPNLYGPGHERTYTLLKVPANTRVRDINNALKSLGKRGHQTIKLELVAPKKD